MDYHIWKKGEKIQLSPNFNTLELECNCRNKDCIEQRFSKALLNTLQTFRNDIKTGLSINSGYRCSKHNVSIGGAKNSNHTRGEAVDLKDTNNTLGKGFIKNPKLLQFYDIYIENPLVTTGWLHMQKIRTKSGLRIFNP